MQLEKEENFYNKKSQSVEEFNKKKYLIEN